MDPTGPDVSFDLSNLQHPASYYKVKDMNAEKVPEGSYDPHGYIYAFNVCGNIGGDVPVPEQHHDGTPVTPEEGACKDKGTTPALQIATSWNGCYRLAADVTTDEGAMAFELFDQDQPHKGVTITYPMGEKCGDLDVYRDLKVAFLCEDNVENTFDEEEEVEETDTCHYELFIKSAYGCPTSCPVTDGHVCNNHGVCGYNTESKTASCFCNQGWQGAGCTTASTSEGLSGTGVVLIIMCVILALIVGAVAYMGLKLRRLNVDPSSFTELKGLYNELGQIA